MVFKMRRKANDDKLFHKPPSYKNEENIFTLGRASYCDAFNIFFYDSMPLNILGGRFSSLAKNILFHIGGTHSFDIVSSYPFDVETVVKPLFNSVRPELNPLPNLRKNPRQIIFGNDVWIGRDVTIMGGVKIANGAVIGSNSIITKNIPPYAIVVGNPSRVVKYRFDEETIKKLLAVKWWNWSLEKIADNLPLMNDPEKFLETNYSSSLEEFGEDDFTYRINSAAKFGGHVYHFIPDFRAQNPLWSTVVTEFIKSNFKNKMLVIWLDKDSTDEDAISLKATIGDNENILTFKHDKNFSPTALRQGTHFITTREMVNLEALDYLWDTDVKIISALDDKIFSR